MGQAGFSGYSSYFFLTLRALAPFAVNILISTARNAKSKDAMDGEKTTKYANGS